MLWIKQGLIFQPPKNISWLASHTAVPCAVRLEGSVYKVFYTGRDSLNRSHVSCFQIDLANPTRVLHRAEEPILSPGPLGSFDEHGVMTSWITRHGDEYFFYYTGWSRGLSVPFVNSIGLAKSQDGGHTFSKISEGPLLSRNVVDAYFVANPCILKDQGIWRMWYLSGVRWEMVGGKPKHYYHIRYAHSGDGIHWQRRGRVCIDFRSESEYALSRPCVVKEGDFYRMWYSYRGEKYRIGYAESLDGICWKRLDQKAGIDASESGWDSEMIEYAFVFRHDHEYYMLYNGNDYGKTGIGLAILA